MKKILILLIPLVVCSLFCSCSSFNENYNSNINENNNMYIKNITEIHIPTEIGYDTVKTLYEYNDDGFLISEKVYSKYYGAYDYIKKGSTYFSYDDNGMIELIEYTDGYTFEFEKYYQDNYCFCNSEVNETKIEYTYQNNILVKKELIDNGITECNFYDDEGKLIRSEILLQNSRTEVKYNDNEDVAEQTIFDSNGNKSFKINYIYNNNFLVQEIQENIDDIIELNYYVKKIDENSYKSIQLENDGNYIMYLFDDYGNLIEKSSYSNNELINKTEYEWAINNIN